MARQLMGCACVPSALWCLARHWAVDVKAAADKAETGPDDPSSLLAEPVLLPSARARKIWLSMGSKVWVLYWMLLWVRL